MERELKLYINSLTADTTYVVSEDCEVSSTVDIPANVTLIFKGGKITGKGTLNGNRTALVAPIVRIFNDTVNITGSWEIDRAYPQWFGAVAYSEYPNPSFYDSTEAINKAIIMKRTGAVHIPKGVYLIGSTIKVRNGIELIGEPGIFEPAVPAPEKWKLATIFIPKTNGSYTDNFLIRVNPNDNGSSDPDYVAYPQLATLIKDIHFNNNTAFVHGLRGIFVQGAIIIDKCMWYCFQQAVQRSNVYSDMVKITNCSFAEAYTDGTDTKVGVYAFDLNGLGDSFVFEHNEIDENRKKINGLRVYLCNGGSITSNVINNDVYIESSKGMTYSSNHMENGAQITIDRSNVTTSNNFIQKGDRVNIVLKSSDYDMSVVESKEDLFLFYDQANATPNIVNNIHEYDVQIDEYSIIRFDQTYRYWVTGGLIGRMYPFGIAVCKGNGSNLEDFNRYSYLLSSEGRIMPGYNVINSVYQNKLLESSMYGYGLIDFIKWLKTSGTYYYNYQIIWDQKRLILGQTNNLNWVNNDVPPNTNPLYRVMTLNGDGLLIVLANALVNGNQVMVRLYRVDLNKSTEYVDIPFSGSLYCYDNGYSVCGYRWKPFSGSILTGNTNISSIRYNGINIECKAPAPPTAGTWEEGDIVYNTAASGTIAHWIRINGNWVAR